MKTASAFQVRWSGELSDKVRQLAWDSGITKHEFVIKAIEEKIEKESGGFMNVPEEE